MGGLGVGGNGTKSWWNVRKGKGEEGGGGRKGGGGEKGRRVRGA